MREVREHRNLTRDKLARKVGVSSSAIKNIESGRNDPSLATFQYLADALQVPVETLLKPVGSPIPAPRRKATPTMRRAQVLALLATCAVSRSRRRRLGQADRRLGGTM